MRVVGSMQVQVFTADMALIRQIGANSQQLAVKTGTSILPYCLSLCHLDSLSELTDVNHCAGKRKGGHFQPPTEARARTQ